MTRFSKPIRSIDAVLFTLLSIYGCTSSADLISEVSVEDKVAGSSSANPTNLPSRASSG
jgi:hypothetical protein